MKILTPYRAGYNAGRYRPTIENCHFRWFATKEMLAEWERGKYDGEKAKSVLEE